MSDNQPAAVGAMTFMQLRDGGLSALEVISMADAEINRLKAALKSAEEGRQAATARVAELETCHAEILEEYKAAEAQLCAAQEALRRYGRHDGNCQIYPQNQVRDYGDCTCGYDAVLEADAPGCPHAARVTALEREARVYMEWHEGAPGKYDTTDMDQVGADAIQTLHQRLAVALEPPSREGAE